MKNIFLILILCTQINAQIGPVSAQTGPGGVTTSNEIWLISENNSYTDAGSTLGVNNSSIQQWNDVSGNSNNAIETTTSNKPTLKTNFLNGYSALEFDGSNDRILATGVSTSSQVTLFTVIRHTGITNGNDGIIHAAPSGRAFSNSVNRKSIGMWIERSSTRIWGRGVQTNNSLRGLTKVTALAANTRYLITQDYDGTNINQYVNAAIAGTITYDGTLKDWSDFGIGRQGNESFTGTIGEVIVFTRSLNLAEKIIVENYLSAKYNTALSSNDFYNEDTTGGGFDHNVAGIGQASDGTNHTDSQGTGIININTPSSLSNDDFLFWGEDVKDANYDFSSSLSTNYVERIDTKWRVSKRNNLGTVTFSVREADLTFNSSDGCNQLQLVIDSNSDFSSPTSTHNLTLSSGVYTATGISFSDNDYFTLQYVDQVVLDGATAYNGSGGSNKPNTSDDCYKLLVKSNALSLTENGDVREVEVESGAILAVATGNRLQVTNGINNSGEIRLVGTSQLVQTHTGTNLNTGSGNLFVDQTASTSSVYHSGYWTSPVTTNGTTFTIDGVLKDGTNVPTAATSTAGEAANINFISGYDGDATTTPIEISTRWLATFNNATDWTRYVNPTATVLTPGLGWNMKSVGATFTFKGKPNDGNYSFSISANRYSLLGNPYPSALDPQAFIADNSGQFDGKLYIYNSTGDNSHVRANSGGTYGVIVSGVAVGVGPFLPIGQAFFVSTETSGPGTLNFTNSQRVSTNIAGTSTIIAKNSNSKKKVKANKLPVLKIGFKFQLNETEKRSRQVAVAFRGLTHNYETNFDAEMWSLQPTDLYLKVADKNEPFIITGIESFNEELEIPLVVKSDIERNVLFSLDEIKNIDAPVYLLDKTTNTFYDLKEDEKTIHLIAGEFTDRFFITFKTKTLSNDVFLNTNSFIKIFKKNEEELLIENPSELQINDIKIYNMLGQEILNHQLKTNKKVIRLDIRKFSKAIYILSLQTNKGQINKKIVLE